MTPEESLHFVQQRLSHHGGSWFARDLLAVAGPRITRRFALEMIKGEARTFERVDGSVRVHCNQGSLWITHDGDPKDVILAARDSYPAQREDAMHVFALQDSALEIEFEDEALSS